jgi:hypothetical protein
LAADVLVSLAFTGIAYGGKVYAPYFEPGTNVTSPPVSLQGGTAGSSTIYANNTSAKVSAVAPRNWLSGWEKRVKITISKSSVSGALSGFPVLVHLSSSSGIYGDDVRFVFNDLLNDANRMKMAITASDGTTQCYAEIEKWDTANKQAWLWSKIPSLSNIADTILYVYYDRNQADNINYIGDTGSTAARNVWDSNFKGVWHLSETSGGIGAIKDSTSNYNAGTTYGSPTLNATGRINGAISFDGVDDFINMSNSQSLQFTSSLTIEGWINLDSFGAGSDVDSILRKGEANPNDYQLAIHDQRLELMIEENDGAGLDSSASLSATTWYYVSGTWNGSTRKVYLNGFEDGSGSKTGNIIPDTRAIYIGGRSGTDLSDGILDEIRASNTTRSASWVKASYESERDNLLDFGSEELRSYYPTNYNTLSGNWISGALPASVQSVDSNYFVVGSAGSATSTTAYNPSGYNLLGSTALVSGTTSDLVSNNGAYMQYRSYEIVSTAKTDAFVAYRDSTTSLYTTKERTWKGDTTTWGSQGELPTSGSPVRFVRVAYSPIQSRSYEKIVATLSDDGSFDAYVWNGTSWAVTNNIASCGTSNNANDYRCFDLAYEKTTGRALLVYSRGTTTNETGYKIWTYGSGWSGEGLLDLAYTTNRVCWIALAQCPGTRSGTADDNEIALIYIDANNDVLGYIWTGSSWSLMGATAVWDDTAATATEECIAVEYEKQSGRAMFIWGDTVSTDNYNRIWDGSALSGPTLEPDITTQGGRTNWVTLKSNPASNELLYLVVDGSNDLNTAYWDGSTWTIHAEHDGGVDVNGQRCADFAWESTGNKGLLVWGTSDGAIAYKAFTAPNTWGSQQNPSMGSNAHRWVQLRTNPRSISGDVKILGAVLESVNFDIGAISWDGSTFSVIGSNTISADTTVFTYECFDVEFENSGPKQFVSEIELTGTSNTESWNNLVWNFDSAWTIGSVTVTIQVYNYTGAGGYPTSGVGFKSYTSSSTANTDETMTETIITNPTIFRDGSGNWKMKVKGVKKTITQFDFKADWIEFKPSHYSEYTVSTEFLFSSMTKNTPTQLNFTVVSEYDIASVSVTIQVWNYSSSAYVASGQGYLTYTSSGTNETRFRLITTNPQFYTSTGNAKIKITGVLSTTTQYQQKSNQVKLVFSYSSSSNYNYVLKIVNQVSDAWKIRLTAYSQSNIGRLNNCTIYFRNSSDGTSRQIYIQNGAYVTQIGPWYDLPASPAERYIAITLDASATGESYVYVYLEILIPDKTTYARYILRFEIT